MPVMRYVCVVAQFCLYLSWKELPSASRWYFVIVYVLLLGLTAPSHTLFWTLRSAAVECETTIALAPSSQAPDNQWPTLFEFSIWK